MVVAEKISEFLQQLPEPMQAEVLHFAEFLASRIGDDDAVSENRQWTKLSLSLAMRGMEDETMPEYSAADLKESFE